MKLYGIAYIHEVPVQACRYTHHNHIYIPRWLLCCICVLYIIYSIYLLPCVENHFQMCVITSYAHQNFQIRSCKIYMVVCVECRCNVGVRYTKYTFNNGKLFHDSSCFLGTYTERMKMCIILMTMYLHWYCIVYKLSLNIMNNCSLNLSMRSKVIFSCFVL